MNTYKRHRLPPDIIAYSVWLYYRFNLSHRDIEDLLAERGIIVTRESIRLWCIKFGALYSRRLKRKHNDTAIPFTSMQSSPVCRTIQLSRRPPTRHLIGNPRH